MHTNRLILSAVQQLTCTASVSYVTMDLTHFLLISIPVIRQAGFTHVTQPALEEWWTITISSCFSEEGTWKTQTQECWLHRMMFLSLASVLFGRFDSHFLPWRGQTSFSQTLTELCKKPFQYWPSMVLLAHVLPLNENKSDLLQQEDLCGNLGRSGLLKKYFQHQRIDFIFPLIY